MSDTALVFILAFGAIYAVWVEFARRHRDRKSDIVINRIDAVLTVWAQEWGEPPPLVRAKLIEALRAHNHAR